MRTALVLGGAACVTEDVDAALALGEFQGVVGCNDVGIAWPGRMAAWVSLHSEKLGHWSGQRAMLGLPTHTALYGHRDERRERPKTPSVVLTDFLFEGQTDTGSSGLFALKVALVDLGFDRAVVCGCPMTPAGRHFFDDTAWAGAAAHRRGWSQALPMIKDRTRSMSGWTATLLGLPDTAWLA